MYKKNIKTWVEEFNEGKYDLNNLKVQLNAGWISEIHTAEKTKKYGKIISSLKIQNDENYYLTFKTDGNEDVIRFSQIGTCITVIEIVCRENKYFVYKFKNNDSILVFESDENNITNNLSDLFNQQPKTKRD